MTAHMAAKLTVRQSKSNAGIACCTALLAPQLAACPIRYALRTADLPRTAQLLEWCSGLQHCAASFSRQKKCREICETEKKWLNCSRVSPRKMHYFTSTSKWGGLVSGNSPA